MPANPDSLEIVQLEKQESAALGGDAGDEQPFAVPLDPTEDMIEVAGVTFVEAGDTRPIRTRAIWPDGNDLRFRDPNNPGSGLTLSQLAAGALWSLVSGYLQPLTNGQGVRLYDSTGNQWAILERSGGNFSISVGGTDAQALYKNCKKEVTQLSGTTTAEYAEVSNGVDASCHTIYADRTTKLYGRQRHTNAGSASEYMDVGRDAAQGYIYVYGGSQLLQLTQKMLDARLSGLSTSEFFRVLSDLGDCFRVFANRTARFYGDVTHEGNVLPDVVNTRDLGTSALRWRNAYLRGTLNIDSGTFASTQLRHGVLETVNTALLINGGFGLSFSISNVIGDAIAKFIGNAASQRHRVRGYYGTGTGNTWLDISHNGTNGEIACGQGHIVLTAKERSVVPPSSSVDPPSMIEGGIWHHNVDNKFRGRLNSVTRDFSMEFPPAATNPASGMVDGDRYYNTTLKRWMSYDSSRAKWFTESARFGAGYQGTLALSAYLRAEGYVQMSASLGWVTHTAGTIVGFGWTRGDSDAATFELCANGVALTEIASAAVRGYDMSLNADFAANVVLSVRNKSTGNAMTNPLVWVEVRWRV